MRQLCLQQMIGKRLSCWEPKCGMEAQVGQTLKESKLGLFWGGGGCGDGCGNHPGCFKK